MTSIVKLKVLGVAQDGGMPQPGCLNTQCACAAARTGARGRERVASLGLSVSLPIEQNKPNEQSSKIYSYIFDATPDFGDQLFDLSPNNQIDAVFLTHAHYGHFVGLLQLGKEVMNLKHVPVYCSASMKDFLSSNQPFRALIDNKNIEIVVCEPNKPISLCDNVSITPFEVPVSFAFKYFVFQLLFFLIFSMFSFCAASK